MKATKPGVNERYLHGVFLEAIMERGAKTEAYFGIVAGGNNATTLHYRFNESTLESGQLVLSDCGAEYQWYSGDITTWTSSGPIAQRSCSSCQSAAPATSSSTPLQTPFRRPVVPEV